MPDVTASRWQYSLRTTMIVTTVLAILLTVGEWLGAELTLQMVFVAASLAVPFLLQGGWRRSYLGAYGCVYGPFFAMATYTFFFVSCTHCKATTWEWLPFGPGLIPVELLRHWSNVSFPSDGIMFLSGVIFSGTLIAGVTWLLKITAHWRRLIISLTSLAFSGVSAYVLLCLIRA